MADWATSWCIHLLIRSCGFGFGFSNMVCVSAISCARMFANSISSPPCDDRPFTNTPHMFHSRTMEASFLEPLGETVEQLIDDDN